MSLWCTDHDGIFRRITEPALRTLDMGDRTRNALFVGIQGSVHEQGGSVALPAPRYARFALKLKSTKGKMDQERSHTGTTQYECLPAENDKYFELLLSLPSLPPLTPLLFSSLTLGARAFSDFLDGRPLRRVGGTTNSTSPPVSSNASDSESTSISSKTTFLKELIVNVTESLEIPAVSYSWAVLSMAPTRPNHRLRTASAIDLRKGEIASSISRKRTTETSS